MSGGLQKLTIIKIAPSILAADFGRLQQEIDVIEKHSDELHIDVMDGHFVPAITMGPVILQSLKTTLPIDVHLMVFNPEKYVEAFARAGAKNISFHVEATQKPGEVIATIRKTGCTAGIAINPETPIEKVMMLVPDVDRIVVMSVRPGAAGQLFIPSVLSKVMFLRKMTTKDIVIDGGITADNVKKAVDAGANIIVAANAIFGQKDRVKAIELLRKNS
ncbi:MAG TPA: ribulose-phosphate 3-epimerase [Candidatus Nanoarchaeia archaeon]|nr:ribulose-phosphate 3-epimerase [Candidatus Nanoarchaeia archaeon]